MIHIWRPWKLSIFQDPPTPLVHLRLKFFYSLDLGRPISNEPPSPNDNHSIKRKHNPRMTIYVFRSFLQVAFRFQYQLVHLVWLSFDFFSLSWCLTICFFVALYSGVCSCVHKMSFIYNYSHFQYLFCYQTVFFPQRIQTVEQQPHRGCEWTKSKQK